MVAIIRVQTQIQGLALEFRGGHLLDVLCDPIEGRIAFTDQSTPGMVYKSAELPRSDVMDPLNRCTRIGDDILTILSVEMSELNAITSLLGRADEYFMLEYPNHSLVKSFLIHPISTHF